MLKAMSTYVYVKERLHPGLLDGLVRGGAQAIEIFAARQHLDYANRKAACARNCRLVSEPAASRCIPFIRPCTPTTSAAAPARRR